jgi:hypothetical protein
MATIAENKLHSMISTSARTARRNKIKPTKANFVTIYETHTKLSDFPALK